MSLITNDTITVSPVLLYDWLSENGSVANLTNGTPVDNTHGQHGSDHVANYAKLITFLDQYLTVAIIVIGLVGNAVSFSVFVFTYLNRLSSSVYLAALACADGGFLFCLLVSWSSNIGIQLYNTPGWCQLFTFLTYVYSYLSVWFVVCFSVERYIAVCLPLRRHDMCTPRRAKIVVVTLSFVSALLYNFALWTSTVQDLNFGRPYCSPLMKYYQLIIYANNIDTILTLVAPSCIIFVTNVRIVYVIVKLQRQRRISEHNETRDSFTHSESHVPRFHTRRSSQSSQMKVTKLLIVVSSIFLLLNLPSHFIRLYAYIMSVASDTFHPSRTLRLTQQLFQYVYYSNFSVNFFLYSTCGRNFRCALVHLGRNIRYRLRRCITWRRNNNGDDIPVIPAAQKSSSSSSQKPGDLRRGAEAMTKGPTPKHSSGSGVNVKFHRVMVLNGIKGNSL